MNTLVKLALVGTANHPGGDVTGDDHAAGELLRELPADDREHHLLLHAGARAVFDHCGRRARSGAAAIATAPEEERPCAPGRLIPIFQQVLASSAKDLLADFLWHLRSAGLLLPHELLPEALNVTDRALREALLPTLGQRGRWLSQFQPQWEWVSAGVGDVSVDDRTALRRMWDEGKIGQRCAALAALRRADGAEARGWLSENFAGEKAEHRAQLLESLQVGLSADDAPFLEDRLDDRSSTVKLLAAGLLARLPGSALAARMLARADAMLSGARSGLRRKLALTCSPPEEIDKDWERDGVSPKSPQAGRGKRSCWVESVIAAVPPAHWRGRFEAEPATLIAAVADDPFASDVLAGWTRAAATFAALDQASAEWLRPLCDAWREAAANHAGTAAQSADLAHVQSLLSAMPAKEAEAVVLPLLEANAKQQSDASLGLLYHVPRPWSPAFGKGYLKLVQSVLAKTKDDRAYKYHWANTLSLAGTALPPDLLPAALAALEAGKAGSDPVRPPAEQRAVDSFMETIRLRQLFLERLRGA